MDALATWLEKHKEQLTTTAVQELTAREVLRRQVEQPARWFFDHLITVISDAEREALYKLLRNWVVMCRVPINGAPIGLLPVLGVFKRTMWRVYLDDPPPQNALALAAQLDGVMMDAAEYLSRIEAAALFDAFSHQLATHAPAKSQVEATQDSFVSLAAHELKTPLTVIEGYANMLGQMMMENPSGQQMVHGIQSGINRLRGLIEDMIDVSLIEIGLLKVDFQPMWLQRLMDIVEFEARKTIRDRDLTLTFERDTFPTQPTVGDPERLLKALLKVISNAVKYTPDGGSVTVKSRMMPGFVDITVSDTGIGIRAADLDRIFEKFAIGGDLAYHSSSKTNYKGGGPGLGLVIAKGIVEAHQGTIWAESAGYNEETYPGSNFHIMLPMRDVTRGEGMEPLLASAAGTLTSQLLEAVETPPTTAMGTEQTAGESPAPAGTNSRQNKEA